MNSFTLKMIAIITMLIDHTGAILFPQNIIFRIIGRLAFPIFCFLIAEGCIRTHDIKKYALRLGVFALISEIPFDLALYGEVLSFDHQNVFFTLVIGVLVIMAIQIAEKKNLNPYGEGFLKISVVFIGCFVAQFLRTDYGAMGIGLIVVFYLLRNRKAMLTLMVILFTGVLGSSSIEFFAAFSIIFILLYNKERGPKIKYFFYAFYPGHLLILYLIQQFL